MSRPSTSLRAVVGTVVTFVGALALLTASALVFLTTHLQRASDEQRSATETLRLAQEAEIHLLLHGRIHDPGAQREVERELRELLRRARDFAGSDVAREALRSAISSMDAYLSASDEPARAASVDAAFAALEEVVTANGEHARAAGARAAELDRLGNGLGLASAVLLVLFAGWLLWWLRSRAFEPLHALSDAMKRFGAGDAGVRAPEGGPAELHAIARQFNEMGEALAALRERQLRFLAALAHDIRNPLSALKLATSRPPPAGESSAADARLVLVRRQVLSLERLVSEFLDAARIEAGELEVRPEPVDLRPIVQGVVALFGEASAGHRIAVQLPDEEVVAACDPGRIEQVLNNLVSNAIKYSPEGGRVEIVLERRPDAIAIRVSDEGIGISDEEKEALFEPFRRGAAVRRAIPGTGLGLFISKRLVEAHGGRIRVTGSPGRGSTFEILLPAWQGSRAVV